MRISLSYLTRIIHFFITRAYMIFIISTKCVGNSKKKFVKQNSISRPSFHTFIKKKNFPFFQNWERNAGERPGRFPLFSYYTILREYSRKASRIFFCTSIFLARSHFQLLRVFLYPLMLLSLAFSLFYIPAGSEEGSSEEL